MNQAEKTQTKASPTTDLEVFVLEKQRLVTVYGEEIKVPTLTYGKERAISGMIGDFADSIAAVITKRSDAEPDEAIKVGAEAIADLVKLVFAETPEKISKAMSILLSTKDNEVTEEWVDDNLVSDSIFPFLIPFLANRKEALSKAFAPYMGNLGILLEGLSQLKKQ